MIDFEQHDFSNFDPTLLGQLSFSHTSPSKPPLQPGRNLLGLAEERDTVLYVPTSLDVNKPVPLMVMFHGGGGSAEKVLPFLEQHAERNGFLLLVPQSLLRTWDIVHGGHGPDLERLNLALAEVASRYPLDPERFAFAGFSDGGSYALATGLTNGDLVSHIIIFSAGFMNVFMAQGSPRIFMAHGLADEQLPVETSGRVHAGKLREAGYDLQYFEFKGNHSIQPPIVEMAMHFFLKKPIGRK